MIHCFTQQSSGIQNITQRPIIMAWSHQETDSVRYALCTETWKHINHFKKFSIKITTKVVVAWERTRCIQKPPCFDYSRG